MPLPKISVLLVFNELGKVLTISFIKIFFITARCCVNADAA